MAVRTILQLGDPGLREVAARVVDSAAPEIRVLVADLADTLAHWRATTGYGRGIAAPQIGVGKRVIFLQLPGAEAWPLVNPEITWRSAEKIVVWDACLSFLSIFMQVERHREIVVRYQDLQGEWKELRAGEQRDLSELLQHELAPNIVGNKLRENWRSCRPGRSNAAPLRGTLPRYWFDWAYHEDPRGCAQHCHYAGDYENPEKIAGALND